jgi:Rrf2 family protein
MTIQISRKCEYAVLAMAYIAGLGEGKLYTAKNIAHSTDIPLKFLEKILQALVSHNLLQVTYGPRGGYRLARGAKDITFRDIIEAVEGPLRLNLCVGEEPRCSAIDCSMKNHWEKLQGEIEEIFENETLAEAAPHAPIRAR